MLLLLLALLHFLSLASAWVNPLVYHQSNHRYSHLCRLHSLPSSKNEDPILKLPLLEAELALLLAESKNDTHADDFSSSQQQRNDLEQLINDARTAAEFGIRRAQVDFYDAFSSGDLSKMKLIWSENDDIRCIHPGMSSLEGRDDVMNSWSQIFSSGGAGNQFKIEPIRSRIDVCGQTAMCSCVEKTEGGQLEALNIYRREQGEWRMTLHMASPIVVQQGGSAFF